MYSKASDYSYRRQDGDRNLRRNWDDYDDRREERHDFHSKTPRESYYKRSRDGRGSADRVSRTRDYGDSPKRLRSSDSASRDWSRNSPARRRLSPPGRDGPEVKRRRRAEQDDADYRYNQDFSVKSHRLSPASFLHNQQSRYSPSREDDVRYRKTSPYSRHQREEFPLRKPYGDFCDRDSSDCFEASANQRRGRGYSPERTHSPNDTARIQARRRERIPSPSTSGNYDRYYESRTPANGSSGQSFKNDAPGQSTAVPEDKSSKGFQRFLEVLNKGVNVDVLNQIVSQNPTPQRDGCIYQKSLVNVADRRWSPGCTERQEKHYKDNSCWNVSPGSMRSTSPQPYHRSASPNRNPVSVRERFLGSKSPSVEKITLTPEDEEKRKQMQDVLQAIGVDLGFEELGQMSHRIQERLYGKKDNEGGRRLSRERSVGQAFAAGRPSRSSSSRSSYSPPRQSFYANKDSFSDPQDKAETQQSGYAPELYRNFLQDGQSGEGSQISTLTSSRAQNVIPLNPMAAAKQLPPPPILPMAPYPPIGQLPPSYPTVPPPPLPFLPGAAPGIFLPRVLPLVPQPPLPAPSIFPSPLAQTRPPFPTQLQLYNPTNLNDHQAVNAAQKSKPQERHRFLQVIK